MTDREHRELRSVIRKYEYICGSLITPDVSFLAGQVFTKLAMTCRSQLEYAYFSWKKGRMDICSLCGKVGGAEVDKELKKDYKFVLPMCAASKKSGKTCPHKQPLVKKRKA